MNFLKKNKLEILFFFLLSILYFASRFYHLLNLPIFTDEAIYVRWSQIAKNDAAWRFISLTDGKQPMFVWLSLILMHFIKNPLFASRAVSIFSGFGTILGLFLLGRETFKDKWVGLFSSLLYVLYPFALVYDRMALYDSLVTTFAVWGLYFGILLVRLVRLDVALVAGLVIGGGVLNKSNGFFSIYFLPATILLFDWTKEKRLQRLIRWVGFAIVTTVLVYLYYSILRLSPYFHIIADKDTTFIYPFREWIKHPFNFFYGNLSGLINWFIVYFSYPMIFLTIASFFISFRYFKEKSLLVFWFVAPFLTAALFGKVLYPRYIFPMTITLLPMVAFALNKSFLELKKFWILILVFFVAVIFYLRTDYFILDDFSHAPIPSSDLGQFINDWPAGGGVNETTEFFKVQSQAGKIYIATEGTFGLMPAAYEISLVDNPNIILRGLWPINNIMPKELLEASKKYPTFVVFYQPCPSCVNTSEAPVGWPLKLVSRYAKGVSNTYLYLYKVIPQK